MTDFPCAACTYPAPGDTDEDHTCGMEEIMTDTLHETDAPAPMLPDEKGTLVFIDVETFGLDPQSDPPIEIGFVITDLDLNILHARKWLIWEDYYDLRLKELQNEADMEAMNSQWIIQQMHTLSGLWAEAIEDGRDRLEVEQEILDWFESINLPKGLPLVGSSVSFDRFELFFNVEKVKDYFHYRVFDISSLKILFELYAPLVADVLKETVKPKKLHRVFPDLEDTINEFRFYLGKITIGAFKIWDD